MLIPLNIVMTYPVRWTKYQTLRDFIQNFYDSVGYDAFHSRFQYSYQNNELRMWVDQVSFNYEWLLHIGASTKGATPNQAGYFGEGFKIASLCALRDYSWDITMESADWRIHVIRTQHQIDSQNLQMLAYDFINVERTNSSCLILKNISETDYLLFKTVIISFYYPENPLLGDLIWKDEKRAIYTRSKYPIPAIFPYVDDFGRKGVVFCAFQMLGTNPFDLVVCQHNYRKDDRERRALYSFNVIDIFGNISYNLDPDASIKMLEKMRRYWNTYSRKRIDIHSWSPVINNLVYNIRRSEEAANHFRTKYPNLLCAEKVYTIHQRNQRAQAKSWLANQPTHYIIVKDIFQYLGYETIEQLCERNNGFVTDDNPRTDAQIKGFAILEDLIKQIFKGFFIFPTGLPERKIIYNDSAAYHGMAVCHKLKSPLPTIWSNLKVKSRISEIHLKENVFAPNKFYDALATYVHELCHMFGTDNSQAFSLGLTYAIEMLLENHEIIDSAKEKWHAAVQNETLDESSASSGSAG